MQDSIQANVDCLVSIFSLSFHNLLHHCLNVYTVLLLNLMSNLFRGYGSAQMGGANLELN